MNITDNFPAKDDDGLETEIVRSWAEEKYKLVYQYSSLFCKSMKDKWDCLIYIDLFSGSGRSRINHKRIIDAIPLLILSSENKFNRYIFCDVDKSKCETLLKRVKRLYGNPQGNNITILNGDANLIATDILKLLPTPTRSHKVLGFCLIDLYGIDDLKFDTIRTLSQRFMDFLVLIPTGMDANRNVSLYVKRDNTKLDEFLGTSTWREEWKIAELKRESFEIFVANRFSKSMQELEYLDPGIEYMKSIHSDDKNLLLYRLALYSRNPLGLKFWQESVRYSNPQRDLSF